MKRILIFILFTIIVLSVSAKEYPGRIIFISNEVKEVNDSLHVYFKVNIRAGAVNDCTAMYLTPQLLSNGSVMAFPYVLISGNKKYNLIERWKSLNKDKVENIIPYTTIIINQFTDTLLTYDFKVPYEMWMDSAHLVIKQEVTGCRNENHFFTFMMNNKVKVQSHTPYQVNPLVSYIEPKTESKILKIQGEAYLDFQVGKSVILPQYRHNQKELEKINALVKSIINDSDLRIKSLLIEGYASPDGSYAANDRLSYTRAIALKNYMKDKFGFSESSFRVSNIAEDWDRLKQLILQSNIAYKNEIIEIIDNADISDGYKSELTKLANGVPYRQMSDELFPQLRRVEYNINVAVKDYTLDQAKSLFRKKDSQLNQLELYEIAQSYGEGSKEFVEILADTIPKYYPGDQTANNNAGAALILINELSLAKRNLLNAGTNPSSLNNLGVIFLKEGDLDKAEDLFKRALMGGVTEANHNLNELQMKLEDNLKAERYNKYK